MKEVKLLGCSLILSFFSIGIFAQVGINTAAPKATLDVVGKPDAATSADGVIAPRMTGDQLKAKDAVYLAEQTGALVYVTEAVNTPSVKTARVDKPGYYLFNGVTWKFAFGGNDEDIAIGELVYYHGSIPASTAGANILASTYLADLPVLGGVLRLDAQFNANSSGTGAATTFNPRLYNVSTGNIKIWVSEVSTHTGDSDNGNIKLVPGDYRQFDDGVYLTQTHNETVTFDITMQEPEPRWYRVYYAIRVDNKSYAGSSNATTTDTNTADNTRELFLSVQKLY
ncbi:MULTISPECIES: hypothetical protein [unclassified Flavobacterium]|uniref:hypothetical protein n=1 Tax=unclassified Flavobacterium TaxID=196869 RepID=UPI0009611B96|nr:MULTISPECIES: hypothetical protein [unclassified Flavobacterium]MBN9283429.1 hypothetical protein [Flavobacterium sp.]OJV69449.1 MAG: hypothetical protein BGO42_13870 [Flavobacterium sp. 40-81]